MTEAIIPLIALGFLAWYIGTRMARKLYINWVRKHDPERVLPKWRWWES